MICLQNRCLMEQAGMRPINCARAFHRAFPMRVRMRNPGLHCTANKHVASIEEAHEFQPKGGCAARTAGVEVQAILDGRSEPAWQSEPQSWRDAQETPATLRVEVLLSGAGSDVKKLASPTVMVFRALQLGDLLCVVPALRALRCALPHAHIALVGLPWAKAFVSRFSRYLDEFIEFPGHPAFPERAVDEERVEPFYAEMKARKFDLAIQMHGSGQVVNELLARCEPRHLAGFYVMPADRFPPGTFIPWQHGDHEVVKFVRLVESLGLASQGYEMEFPLTEEDRREHEETKAAHGLRRTYVCVHPGARMRSRRWLPERFASVADTLAALGFQVVLTGAEEERSLVQQVAGLMHFRPVVLVGVTSLGGLAALLSEAALLVCNDTGISHVAAGVGTPSVVVTMGSDPVRWAPIDSERHPAVYEEIACRPCAHDVCPIGHPCARNIQVETVLNAALTLLERNVPCVHSAS